MSLNDTFTSTGAKFFAHQEAMTKLRNGVGQPIVTHVMLTDVCNHTCAFCSVQARAGDSLRFGDVTSYLDILQGYGLKAVILSGGGNPILYKCKKTGKDFNDVVCAIHERGLEIGLITNGMPLKGYEEDEWNDEYPPTIRKSWATVSPDTLDKLAWVRISMAGLDHDEREVYVPDIDRSKTVLGFSYVGHDIFYVPAEPHHGKVSTYHDLAPFTPPLGNPKDRAPDWPFEERIPRLIQQIRDYVKTYKPKYVRLLPNCLEPELIQRRCDQMQYMADTINSAVGSNVVFVQYKPPKAPHACYLGYVHPVLNCDGYVYPCDSCVLNEAAGHQFANPWRVCHWSEVGHMYDLPVMSLIGDPASTCPGCVFHQSNEILRDVVRGEVDITPPAQVPEHVNFI
jgi:Radical SAM superfamily